ncbi:hypothetical protein LXL04_003540 [Taraxacum kok-saghyz]
MERGLPELENAWLWVAGSKEQPPEREERPLGKTPEEGRAPESWSRGWSRLLLNERERERRIHGLLFEDITAKKGVAGVSTSSELSATIAPTLVREDNDIGRRGTRAQIVDSSLRMSPLWPSIKKLRLTINMRALADPWFFEFLMRVGDGEGAIDGTFIRIPDDMSIPYTVKGKSKDDLIDAIFPSLQINGGSSDYIISRAILSTKNENVDEINDQLIDSGLPPHYLRLKIGCPIILLRNIDPSNGLCNGTRLICKGFQMNFIDAEIVVGHYAGKRVFLPRIPLCPSTDDMFPFKLKRKQFSVRLSFAMTINKAQGQTIQNVGVYLPESVFSHGQLYVALSRGISRENTKVLVKPVKDFTNEGVYISNVVYREVLHDI